MEEHGGLFLIKCTKCKNIYIGEYETFKDVRKILVSPYINTYAETLDSMMLCLSASLLLQFSAPPQGSGSLFATSRSHQPFS